MEAVIKVRNHSDNVMALAWTNARIGARVHGGKASDYFVEAFRIAQQGFKLHIVWRVAEKGRDSTPVITLVLVLVLLTLAGLMGYAFGLFMLGLGGLFKAKLGAAVIMMGYLALDFDDKPFMHGFGG